MTVLGVCALLLAAGTTGLNRKRTTPVLLVWLILGAGHALAHLAGDAPEGRENLVRPLDDLA